MFFCIRFYKLGRLVMKNIILAVTVTLFIGIAFRENRQPALAFVRFVLGCAVI